MRFAFAIALLATGASEAQVTVFPGNDHSYGVAASRDLRYVAFTSNASNLVPGDTNGQPDVFVLDRQTGVLVRASVDVDGIQGNGPSAWPSISSDGRYVAFDTGAANLANGARLVRKDLQTGAIASGGVTGGYSPSYPSLSDDGRFAASDPGGVIQLHDFATGTKTDVTTGGFFEDAHPVISGDGRYVFFASNRSTLVAGDSNGVSDIFRWDRTDPGAGYLRVSLGTGGVQANAASPAFTASTRPTVSARPFAVSPNGSQIAFSSRATNIDATASGGLFGRNIGNGEIVRFATCSPCDAFRNAFDALDVATGGLYVGFSANVEVSGASGTLQPGYYRIDVATGAIAALGTRGPDSVVFDSRHSMAISDDGATYALQSTELVAGIDDRARYADVFAGTVGGPATLVSRGALGAAGDGHSRQPALSDDGRVVAYASDAANLVAGDTNAYRDVFVRDYATGTTIIASRGAGGIPANGPSSDPSISGDGRVVAFYSNANNLVAGDGGGPDIFVRVLATGAVERISATTPGANGASALSLDGRWVAYTAGQSLWLYDRQGNGTPILASPTRDGLPPADTSGQNFGETYPLSMSDDGRYVAFGARASNQAVGQANSAVDVFVFDRDAGPAGTVELISRANGANGAEATSDSFAPSISGDGRYVAFYSSSPGGMVPGAPGNTTIFLRDRVAFTTQAVGPAPRPSNFRGTEPRPTIAKDGSTVAFVSSLATIVPGDSNALPDVFLWDRASALTRRASLTSAWTQADGAAYVYDIVVTGGYPRFFAVALSRDASILAYGSAATNLGLKDDNAADDIVIVRPDSRAVARVSDTTPPPADVDRSAPVASANGAMAVFVETDRSAALSGGPGARAKGFGDKWARIVAHDFGTGEAQQIDLSSTGAEADGDSFFPSLAPGGGTAAFTSNATNLGSALDSNGRPDLFVRDLTTDVTVSITNGADGDTGRSATTDIGGKWQTVFESNAGNLPGAPSANAAQDIFVAREGVVENTFTITPISVALAGAPNGPSSNPSLAPNGRFAAFASLATNLVASDANAVSDVFVRDVATSTTAQVSIAMGGGAPNGPSGQPAIVAPGIGDKWVAAFESDASNIEPLDSNNDTDVFVRVSDSLAPEKVSNGMGGAPANGKSLNPSISADGRYVAFVSTASNLVPLDLNNAPDVFLYDRVTDQTRLVSATAALQANDFSLQPSVSLDAGGNPIVTWDSAADNLVAGDDDDALDVFRFDAGNGSIASTEGLIFVDGFE